MPIFSQIELFLDNSYSNEQQVEFMLRSRCICNYLERSIRGSKFKTSMSRINIVCTKKKDNVQVGPLKGMPYLQVCINYDLPSIFRLDEESLQLHFADIITQGINAAQSFMPVPFKECLDILEEFKRNGFSNSWIQSRKEWKRLNLRSDVIADLTMYKFSLTQKIYEGDSLLAEKIIVEEKPREFLFFDYLGDLSMSADGKIAYAAKRRNFTVFDCKTRKFLEAF